MQVKALAHRFMDLHSKKVSDIKAEAMQLLVDNQVCGTCAHAHLKHTPNAHKISSASMHVRIGVEQLSPCVPPGCRAVMVCFEVDACSKCVVA